MPNFHAFARQLKGRSQFSKLYCQVCICIDFHVLVEYFSLVLIMNSLSSCGGFLHENAKSGNHEMHLIFFSCFRTFELSW